MTFNLYAKIFKRLREIFGLLGFLGLSIVFQAEAQPNSCALGDIQHCLKLLERVENLYAIPSQLLKAIALTESGRMEGDRFVPWPWTINVNGKGYFYRTKADAIRAVQKFQKQGIRSIDVGCMQINLMHHPHAFSSLEEAFDPAANIRYGAEFLVRLRDSNKGLWKHAVGLYHSGRPTLYEPYRQKVFKIWYENRKKKHRFNSNPYPRQITSPWQSSQGQYLQDDEKNILKKSQEARLVFTKASPLPQEALPFKTQRVPSLRSLRGDGFKMLYAAAATQASATRLRQVKSRLQNKSGLTAAQKFDPPVKKILPLRANYQTVNPNLRPGPLIMAYNSQPIN